MAVSLAQSCPFFSLFNNQVEDQQFYELCDELGILVQQDMAGNARGKRQPAS